MSDKIIADGKNNRSMVIDLMKCLCCLGVVCLHTLFENINVGTENLVVEGGGWSQFVHMMQIILRICVPTFFLLSGYLFCKNYKGWTRGWFMGKYKTRVRSLLVPYLVGNVIVFILFYVSNYVAGGLMGAGVTHNMGYAWYELPKFLWSPVANPVFWFLRDLMIVIALSPILIKLLEKLGWIVVSILGILWFTDVWASPFSGFSSSSFFFFSMGAYFSMSHITLDTIRIKGIGAIVISNLSILVGLPVLFVGVRRLSSLPFFKKVNYSFWMPATFFIYAYHHVVQVPLKKLLFVIIRPESPIMNYVIYLVTVIIVVFGLAFIYRLLCIIMPKYTWLFSGK